jgi:dihydropteroate synthase
MGIVNITADSFADQRHRTITEAIEWGLELVEQGSDLIDVGGESTRPGASRISEADERARVIPVIQALVGSSVIVSVDTVRSSVAEAAIEAGAALINDVSGGLVDPAILGVIARSDAGYVLGHWRSAFDHSFTHTDIVSEVCTELSQRAIIAESAGIPRERLIVDPGIGFGKTAAQNWELIAHSCDITAVGYPVVWGISRKRFLADAYPEPTEPWQRDSAGIACTTILAQQRVWAVRVHSPREHRVAIAVAEEISNSLIADAHGYQETSI